MGAGSESPDGLEPLAEGGGNERPDFAAGLDATGFCAGVVETCGASLSESLSEP